MSCYWKKLGRLYIPKDNNSHAKLLTHAANPLSVHMNGDVYRIFYSGRDDYNRSSVGAVDIDIINHKIIEEHRDPFFIHGEAGSFYSHGVSIGNCYSANGITYMLFMGWQNQPGKHWRGDIGRLILMEDLTLQLVSSDPFIGSDAVDPISLSYPWVQSSASGILDMWYGSTVSWAADNDEMVHVINYATSEDGDTWLKHGLSVPYEIGRAQAFSHPSVLRKSIRELDMWFSYRCGSGAKYRIGYAKSFDNGIRWELDLKSSGIDVSESGWDSEMIEYPFVFCHKDSCYMLYNGNGYGKTGFGLALLVNS